MKLGLRSLGLLFLAAVCHLHAGEFFTDFDFGVPVGSAVYGHAVVGPGGGINNSRALWLTTTEPNRLGTFIVDDLDGGKKVGGFILRFKVAIFNGYSRGADGFSFSFATKLPHNLGESGHHTGLVVSFDSYVHDGKAPPAFIARYNGRVISSNSFPQMRTQDFVDVEVRLKTNATLSVAFDHQPVISDVDLPGFKAVAGVQYGFGARTGSHYDNHFIDDLYLVTAVIGKALPRDEEVAARLEKKASFKAERFFFLSDGNVLHGYFYKPEGDGPFPAVVFHERDESFVSEAGRINPLPRLGELFTSAKYVLCVPIEPAMNEASSDNGENDQALLAKYEGAARSATAALAWLRTQSFVDPERIVLAGDGLGANAALIVASKEKDIRGALLFSPDAASWSAHPALQERCIQALNTTKAPVLLLQPANLDTIDGFFALRSVIESKGEPNDSRLCQPFGQGAMAIKFATDGVELWKKDVMLFLAGAVK